jgi:hypothetical protein
MPAFFCGEVLAMYQGKDVAFMAGIVTMAKFFI